MSDERLRWDGRGRALRHHASRLLIAGLAVAVAGCAIVPPEGAATGSPSPSVPSTPAGPSPSSTPPVTTEPTQSPTDVPTESPSVTPTTATPTATSTATPTAAPEGVKATGSMLTYSNLVSDQLTGTCRTTKDVPTFTLSDANNDFYGTVDIVVVLKAGRGAVTSLRSDFGEDFEGTSRRLIHPDTGSSATVSAKGSTYTVTGKALMYEGSSKKGILVPFTITVTCAGDNW